MTAPHTARDATAATPASVLTDAPILAHYVRDGFVESVHRASLVAIDGAGEVLIRHGGVDSPTFPRSSLMPRQAVALGRDAGIEGGAHGGLTSAGGRKRADGEISRRRR